MTPLSVGYLGPRGTFCQAAADRLWPDGAELVPCPDIGDVLRRVDAGDLDKGVVPIENRLEGGVVTTLDALADDVELLMEAEVEVPVDLVLAGRDGATLDDVTEIVTHPVPLATCRPWVSRHLPGVELRPVSSTARAAAEVAAAHRDDLAAIANPLAIELHGLATLESGLTGDVDNHTRFVQVGRELPARSGWDRTSLVVHIPRSDRPGTLLELLEIFAERQISMTRLESRPDRSWPGQFRFFIDLEGHVDDERVADALAAVKRTQRAVKLLGSYARADAPRAGDVPPEATDGAYLDAAAWVAGLRIRD